MRLFHTSDWHLGQNLHGQERDFEHACFLDWLLRQLKLDQPDVLLIAGDIFDTVNPPVKAQERLYDFIVSAHEQQPLLTIVMIAGNHDSGSRIELPAPLMRRLRTHALGRVLWLDDGQLDAERLLLPLPDASGEIAAWCLALPMIKLRSESSETEPPAMCAWLMAISAWPGLRLALAASISHS